MIDLGSIEIIPILIAIGVVAGMIESTAGGSGLIVVPTLLLLGLAPTSAMATSKLQYTFGAMTAIFRFHKAKLVQWKNIVPMIVVAAMSGMAGAWALVYINPTLLAVIIPFLLLAATAYFIFSPSISDIKTVARFRSALLILFPIALIGFYDGFFGVGSGSFYVLAMVWGLGFSAREATATTKVVDFVSSTSALLLLATQHEVLWLAGLSLGIGQIIGAWIGSGLVIRRGAKFIRPVLAIVSLGLSAKLIFDYHEAIIGYFRQ